jgi:DNA-binding transcriptional ArsR family regulator
MDRIDHAFASMRRREVLEALVVLEQATQQELRKALVIPSSQRGTLSKDVSALEEAGLVVVDQVGRWRLSFPELTGRALQAVADLDREIAAARADEAAKRSRRLRRAAMRQPPKGETGPELVVRED